MAGVMSTSDEYIFRQITFLKKSNSYNFRDVTKPLSYTRAREIDPASLESIGLDKSKFGIYSLRRGGATAACAAGISDRVFKKHGQWKSDKYKKKLLLRCIHLFISDLIYNMDHMRISGIEPSSVLKMGMWREVWMKRCLCPLIWAYKFKHVIFFQ